MSWRAWRSASPSRWERLFPHGERVAQRLGVAEGDVIEAVEEHRKRTR